MDIRFLGHACFEITMGGKVLLLDPFISGNELAGDVDLNSLKPDYILLTHGHGDHVADAEAIAENSGATIISSFEIASWYEQKGIKSHPMNLGGKSSFDFGTVKYVTAVHSSMLPDGSYGGPCGGFVLWNGDGCIYFAGDTALTLDMQLIPRTCPPLDVAILPVGDNFTMGYEDALLASDFINCDNIIGCHFDTFGYIKVDHEKATTLFKNHNKELILPRIGQIIHI